MKRTRTIARALVLASCAPGASAPPAAAPSRGPEAPRAESPRLPAAADDPTVTDPDHYKVVLENDRVRVLRYHDRPGEKTHPHRHPDSVLYALSPFKRRLTFPDGTTRDLSLDAGTTLWIPAQGHIGENIGTTDSEALLVEPRR
jgi:quercetin dioxygenase-like cupin family protein